VAFEFGSPAFIADPYARYAEAQRETPVFRTREGAIYVTRHADCATLLGEERFRRRPAPGADHPFAARTPLDAMLAHWMLFMDPPRHDAVRAAFAPWFSAQSVARLEAVVAETVRELIGQFDTEFVAGFASPLPVLVLCRLLELPAGDRPLFEQWSASLSRALESGTDEQMRAALPTSLAMRDYFRRRTPLPGLSAEETIYGLGFLVWAGHETTRNLLASGMLALCEHPEQQEELRRCLRDEPALVKAAVEELLRYTTPVQKLSRWTTTVERFGDYEVAGETMVTALLGAANRDPAVFGDAQRLELRRSPNRHLSFGRGLHACLGAGLARLEAQTALPLLLGAFRSIEVSCARWRPNSALRGLDTLSLAVR